MNHGSIRAFTGTVGLALLAAACGSGPSSGGPGGSAAASVSPGLAYARCMRAHGVPDWPDPGSSGIEPASTKQIAASSPRFPAAQAACVHLLPNGGQQTQAQILADQRNAVRFAGCMRSHGVPNWPDPTIRPDGAPQFNAPAAGVDLSSRLVMATAQKCQSLLHIDLESVGAG